MIADVMEETDEMRIDTNMVRWYWEMIGLIQRRV